MRPTWRGYELSGWWRRVGAVVVDAALIMGVTLLLLWPFGFDFGQYYDDEGSWVFPRAIDLAYLAIEVVVASLYYVPLMTRWDGRTIGKRLTGIRVIATDEMPLGASTVLLRQTVLQYIVGGFFWPLSLLDCLWPLPDNENRALHDHICHTRVVRDGVTVEAPPPEATA